MWFRRRQVDEPEFMLCEIVQEGKDWRGRVRTVRSQTSLASFDGLTHPSYSVESVWEAGESKFTLGVMSNRQDSKLRHSEDSRVKYRFVLDESRLTTRELKLPINPEYTDLVCCEMYLGSCWMMRTFKFSMGHHVMTPVYFIGLNS